MDFLFLCNSEAFLAFWKRVHHLGKWPILIDTAGPTVNPEECKTWVNGILGGGFFFFCIFSPCSLLHFQRNLPPHSDLPSCFSATPESKGRWEQILLCCRSWQEETRWRRRRKIKTSGKMKRCLGSSVPALQPSLRAQTEHSKLMDAQTPLPSHLLFPPSFCEGSRSCGGEGYESVRRGSNAPYIHSIQTFHDSLGTLQKCLCVGIRLQPGNYAVLSCRAYILTMANIFSYKTNHNYM